MRKSLLVLIVMFSMPLIPIYAAPGDLCYEQIDSNLCNISSDWFGTVLTPLDTTVNIGGVGMGMTILWAILLGILWLKTENVTLVGIVGMTIALTATGLHPDSVGIGLTLFAVSLGLTLYQLIRQRVSILS